MRTILFCDNVTPEGYSVWFLPHSMNITGTSNGRVDNWIYSDKVEQWWYDKKNLGRPQKRKRIVFDKKDGMYYFGGLYLFDGNERIEERHGKVYLVEQFDLVSDVYPEKEEQ